MRERSVDHHHEGHHGSVLARSTRTIRRYLVDLVRFGYVELETRRNARGMHLGLTVTITQKVVPFYEEAQGLARWLAETPAAVFRPFEAVVSGSQGMTSLSPRNQSRKNLPFGDADTGRRAARGRLLRGRGAEVAAPS